MIDSRGTAVTLRKQVMPARKADSGPSSVEWAAVGVCAAFLTWAMLLVMAALR